jgi:hypothetical protein
MALQRSTITAPGNTAVNTLGIGASASFDAVSVGTSANVTDHEIVITAGIGAITASASTLISFYAFASADGTNFTGGSVTNDIISSTSAAVTISANGTNGKFLGTLMAHTASSTIKSPVMSIASAFGCIPSKYVVVATNSTGVALTACTMAVQEIYYN